MTNKILSFVSILMLFLTIGLTTAQQNDVIVNLQPDSAAVGTNQPFNVVVNVDPQGNPITGVQAGMEKSPLATMGNSTEGNLFDGHNQMHMQRTDLDTITYLYNVIIGADNTTTPGTFANINYLAGNTSGVFNVSAQAIITGPLTDTGADVVNYNNVTNGANVLIDDAPTMAEIAPANVSEGDTISVTPAVADQNGDTMNVSTSTLPTGATFDGTTFNWITTKGQAGTYDVNFTVTDSWGLSASKTLHINIGQVNRKNPADVTGDGIVDISDLNLVKQSFNQAAGSDSILDINHDGIIDIRDLSIVAQNIEG